MNIILREMKPEDVKEVEKLGRKAFQGFESLFVSKPKAAMVAESDGKILGAVLYKFYKTKDKKIGYIDYAFTDPEFHGQGIGKHLYTRTIEVLWEKGCDAVSAIVKDDNIGSWKLLIDNGFKRCSLGDMFRYLGFEGGMKQYFGTPFCIATGMEYYLAVRETKIVTKLDNTARQIILFLLINTLLISSAAIFITSVLLLFYISIFTLLAVRVGLGYIGTLFTKESWKFRLTNGGGLITFFVNIVGIFPMIGNWYPETYKKTGDFRKALGVTALVQWKFMFLTSLLSYTTLSSSTLFKILSQFALAMAIYSIIPFYPFDSFGGKRIYSWNKGVYTICLILTCLSFFGHWL